MPITRASALRFGSFCASRDWTCILHTDIWRILYEVSTREWDGSRTGRPGVRAASIQIVFVEWNPVIRLPNGHNWHTRILLSDGFNRPTLFCGTFFLNWWVFFAESSLKKFCVLCVWGGVDNNNNSITTKSLFLAIPQRENTLFTFSFYTYLLTYLLTHSQ